MIMNRETRRGEMIIKIIIKCSRVEEFRDSIWRTVKLSRRDVRLHSAFAAGRLGVIEVRLAEGSRRRDEVIRKNPNVTAAFHPP